MHVKTVCREVRPNGGNVPVLFVLVAWKGASFDVRATDGFDAWEAVGCACPPNTAVGERVWLMNAEKALVAGERGYDIEAEGKLDGTLEIRWFWHLENVAPATRAMGRCGLKPSPNAKEAVQGILRLACGSFDAMRAAVERTVAEKNSLEARLAELKRIMEQRVEEWEAREGDVFERFAVLINSSRARTRELEGKLDSARGGAERKAGSRDDDNSDPYDAMTEDDSLPDEGPSNAITAEVTNPITLGGDESPKVIETSVRTAGPVFGAMDVGLMEGDQRGGDGAGNLEFMNMDTQPIRDTDLRGGGDFGPERVTRVRARVRARPAGRKK